VIKTLRQNCLHFQVDWIWFRCMLNAAYLHDRQVPYRNYLSIHLNQIQLLKTKVERSSETYDSSETNSSMMLKYRILSKTPLAHPREEDCRPAAPPRKEKFKRHRFCRHDIKVLRDLCFSQNKPGILFVSWRRYYLCEIRRNFSLWDPNRFWTRNTISEVCYRP
jgi:hypothetical protein